MLDAIHRLVSERLAQRRVREEFGGGHHPAQRIMDELLTKLHSDDLLPRHPTLLEEPETRP